MTLTCPNCGSSNSDDEVVCQECGLTLDSLSGQRDETTRPEHHHTQAMETIQTALPSVGEDGEGAPDTKDTLAPVAQDVDDEIDPDAPSLRIGFDQDNDLVVPVPQVSAHHAELVRTDDGFVIRDLHSTNGTSVNGRPVQQAFVEVGDRIGLGSYEFQFDKQLAARVQSLERQQQDQQLPSVTIGRGASCDIVLDASQISRRHVRLDPMGDNRWHLEDLDSANGTFVNDRNHRVEETTVTSEDVLFLGSYRFPMKRIDDFISPDAPDLSTQSMRLPDDRDTITIGRGEDNDVVIDAPQVSHHHAVLHRSGEGMILEDRGSANGTFVDGERIDRAQVDSGQDVSFGSYAVRLDLEEGIVQKSYEGDILLQAENLRVEVDTPDGPLRILDGVSFTAYPTEFVGLLGPSGAGKTTLMNALIGYTRPTYGRTLLNGDELLSHYDRYRGAIGYVPQDDIIHRQLTVYEALYYTAKLRLPPDTTDAEIDRRIHQVLTDLEIEETRDTIIGSPERKGISGGQRKRVNLAMELLTDPSLLCLDEPTSGLASEDAVNVMRMLRRLADRGKTILLTIHQPSLEVYRLLDNTIYLADGEQVYYGPAFPDSFYYFNPEIRPNTPEAEQILADPGNVMRPLVAAQRAGEPMETFAARYRHSPYYEEFVEERQQDSPDVNVSETGERQPPRFSFRQFMTLSRRYLNIKLKDRVGTLILLVQAPIVAVLLNMVFVAEGGTASRMEFTPLALFLLVISAIWFGCSNAAREIVDEQAIYRRERMVNLSIPAYIGSKFSVLSLLCLVQCVALVSLTYVPLDFYGAPLAHLGVLWLCSLAGVAAGLLLSALVRTSVAAIALVPILLIPQVILGGAIMPVDRMDNLTRAASAASFSRWGFEATLQLENASRAYEWELEELPASPDPENVPAPPTVTHPLERFFGETETDLFVDLGVLGGFTVVLLGGVAGALRYRERKHLAV